MGIFMLNGRMYTGLINVYDSGWQKIGTNVKTASWTQENETVVYFLVYWNAYQLWTVFKGKNGAIRSNKIAYNGDIGGDPTFTVSGSTITATWGAFNDVKILKEERNSVLPPIQYSNTEQLIGTWTDGKPLYETTVHINALPDSTQIGQYVEYPHGISNIDTIVDFNGIVHFANGNAVKATRLGFNANSFNPAISFDAYCSLLTIRICVGSDRSNTNADFVIRYTKTTD